MTDVEVRAVTLPPHLDHEALVIAQRDTLNAPRRPYGVPAKVLFQADYGSFQSLADLFRQIGHDERVHKQESLAQMRQPRFR
jgi:hypothetical protein